MTDAAPHFKVIIIGAGLAGSLLANGLINNNIQVAVYERLPRNAKHEGYQIRLGAYALQGFRACLSKEQVEAIVKKFGRAGGTKSSAPVIYDQNFNELLNLSRFPVYSKSAPVNRVVLRDALAQPIFEAGKLFYESKFVRYEILEPGSDGEKVRVWFDDESFDNCDVLVGADGGYSAINKLIGLNNLSQITDYVSIAAKSDLPSSEYKKMNHMLLRSPVMAFADSKTVYYCAYLPLKNGDAKTPTESSDIDESLSSSYLAVQIPYEDCPPDIFEKSDGEKWEVLLSQFQTWSKEYHQMINLLKGSKVHAYQPRVSKRPSKNWRAKVKSSTSVEAGHPRVWLLGDAIHAMLPTRGMGGNQAMADTASMLPSLIKLADLARKGQVPTTKQVERACEEYEGEMIPRAFRWVEKSGGANVLPLDSSTIKGKILFFLAAQMMNVAYIWYKFVGFFTDSTPIDDAPELK